MERLKESGDVMMVLGDRFTVAAVQAAPSFLNRDATVEKACRYILEAGCQGARLVVLPEAFIPTYPDWIWAIPASEGDLLNNLYAELVDQSVTIPSDATDRLCDAAKEAQAYVVVGMNEVNAEASGASLYNTLLYISDQGQILGKHRKLVPTGAERLVWAQGDGSTLEVYSTPLGKLGGLICWENYMPLARYALYAWGIQIYVASTWDRSDVWLATLRHIASEGRVFVIGCCTALRRADIPDSLPWKERYYAGAPDWINVGNSAIVAPTGEFLAGPCREKEEILYAEVDPQLARGSKRMLDVAGHYARPDVFELVVHRPALPMITMRDVSPTAESSANGRDVLS
jgi:nitrilase